MKETMSDRAPVIEISVVVPTLNEAGNLPELAGRIDAALGGRRYEIILIDDSSSDGTVAVCDRLRRKYPLRLISRSDATDGLSGAVLHGLSHATGEYLVVMDADLQHPPEQIVDLLEPLRNGQAEFVLGSRYIPGATTDGKWGVLRRANSWAATALARPFSGATRDPMSGFFALQRGTFLRADGLNPIGYKIALELICKCRVMHVTEVPIQFGLRTSGKSKLTIGQQVRYLDHLSRLYDFSFPRASTWAKFFSATACAWLVAYSLYMRLVAHLNPVLAPTMAFAAAAATTAGFHLRSLRTHGRSPTSRRDWIDFCLVILGEWSICAIAARGMAFDAVHISIGGVFLVAFGAAAVARYTLRTRMLHSLRGLRVDATERSALVLPQHARKAA
jgi:dolichol-phosphate mannosyltransferase